MKLGKKFQKINEKKFIKRLLSIVGIMMTLLILVLLFFGAITKNDTEFKKLESQRFIMVNTSKNSGGFDQSFDFKKQRYYGYQIAIDEAKTYGVTKNKTKVFNAQVNRNFSIFKYLKLSNKEIKNSSYVIEREIEPLLNKEEFKKEFPSQFEALYLNAELTKIRIEYNQKFLPIKVEGYYYDKVKKRKDWYLMRTISYPYKNKKEFDKGLAYQIEGIKERDAEREYERQRDEELTSK